MQSDSHAFCIASKYLSPVDQLFSFTIIPAESTHTLCLLFGEVTSLNEHLAPIHVNSQ